MGEESCRSLRKRTFVLDYLNIESIKLDNSRRPMFSPPVPRSKCCFLDDRVGKSSCSFPFL